MSEAVRPARAMQSGWRWLPLSAVLIVIDQLSKAWIESNFRLYESVAVLPVLDITRVHNPGAAFSFLADAGGWQRWFFSVLALGVGGGLIWWLRGIPSRGRAALCGGLALIVAGALGNLIDRLQFGHVVDFVHAHWGSAYFPAFNVADAAITIGAGLVILDGFLHRDA